MWFLLIFLVSLPSTSLAVDSRILPAPATAAARQSSFVTASGSLLIAPNGSELRLRGISLGNWLLPEGYMFGFKKAVAARQIREVTNELLGPDESARFWNDFEESYITQDDIRLIARCGFNSIRIPFHYAYFQTDDSPPLMRERGFELLDRLIRWASIEHLYVILDLHAAPGGQTGENIDDGWGYPWLFESPVSQQRCIDLWRRIAEHYRDEPTVLGYELLNEPIPHFPEYQHLMPLLEPLYKKITTAVRDIDPHHLIVLGGAKWNSDFTVFGAPFASNLIYAFHKYWTEPDVSVIREYLTFRDRYQVPIWCGETGENSLKWITAFCQTLEQNRVSWCFWPYKKMVPETCIVTIRPPAGWDNVIRYADTFRGGTYEEKRKARPSREAIRKTFQEFSRNIRFSRGKLNAGFIKALGMTVPTP
ncbi:MAG: cellulase family glycosylhydrolase [Candidatus Ozemobacteraceae bacterium]